MLTLAGPEAVRSGPALQSLSVIQDGSVLIEDGTIIEVGSTRRIENLRQARGAFEVDVHGSVLMPGFVDSSVRVSLTSAGPTGSRKSKRVGQFYEETLDLLRSCVLNGTLTVELKGTAALDRFHSDLGVLRRLAKIGNRPARTVRCWQLASLPQTEDAVTDFLQTLQALLKKSLIQFIELPINDDSQIGSQLVAGVQSSHVGVKLMWSGQNARLLADAIVQLRPWSIFCSKNLGADEMQVLKAFPGTIIFAPGRALGVAGLAGMRAAIDAGLPVALASGYDADDYPSYSMQMAVSLASLYGNLTLEEAITAATVNAAHALGLGETHGSIMRGKRADLLVLNIPDYRDIPRHFGINHVRLAVCDGEVVLNRSGWKIGSHEPAPAYRVRSQRVGGP